MEGQSESVLAGYFVEATKQNGMVLGILGWPFVFRDRIECHRKVSHGCDWAQYEVRTFTHGVLKHRGGDSTILVNLNRFRTGATGAQLARYGGGQLARID